MNANKKEIPKALDDLFQDVASYRDSRNFLDLFKFIKRFPKIAPYNAFLLHVQKPGSQYVLSVEDWKNRFQRTLKPGARPLVILWPFAPVHFLFELGDTEGKEPFPEDLLSPFRNEGRLDPEAWENLVKNMPGEGIGLFEADHGTGSAGFVEAVPTNELRTQEVGKHTVRILANVVVNRNHRQEEKFATVTHELGHLFCGHLGNLETTWLPRRSGLTREIEEFEAECVAYLVCERAGLKTTSAEYLAGYTEVNDAIPAISVETVLKVAGLIEAMGQGVKAIRKELVSAA